MNDDVCSSLERAFDAAWSRSDEIFNLIPTDRLLERPISLRHPFLFYLGHLPAFAWNQVGNAFLGEGQLDPSFDTLFERGIDPADDDRAREQSISSWPGIGEVMTYRNRVRSAIRQRIPEVLRAADDVLGQRGRILHAAIEHELMHHETLMYMLAQCPEGTIVRPEWALPPEDGPGKTPELRDVSAGVATVGAEFNDVEFGWDNEFGKEKIFVPAFRIDSLPVRNRDWLDFIKTNQLDERWMPAGWLKQWRELFVRTVFGPVPFELAAGWPVQVSREQAWAYCAWRGGRLPTEADLHRAAYGDDHERMRPWSDVSRDREAGDFGFSRWYPSPTGRHPASASVFGVEELVGNGWEWTCTPFLPRSGFKPYIRSYPGYSADFFDGQHDVVFGASWATDPVFLRRSFRNWYRSNYPYAFTKFRVVYSS